MTAIIVDDEKHCREVMEYLLHKHCSNVNVIANCSSGAEALLALQNNSPDILFLDIEMPGMNGFELLEKFQHPKFEIVFTTAYNEFAIKAIKRSALDYLLKPVDKDELKATILRFIEKQSYTKETEQLLQNLVHNLKQKEEGDFKIAVPTIEGAVFFTIGQIIRCEGEGNYTWFYLSDGRRHLSAKTMKEYEDILLQHQFLRIHKSHLVNRKFIENYMHDKRSVVLSDKTELPVAKQRKNEITRILFKK